MTNLSSLIIYIVIGAITKSVFSSHHDDYYHEFHREDCFDAPEYVSCGSKTNLIPVWTWDYRYEKCILDTAGGCKRTNNSFHSKEHCKEIAKPVCNNLNIYLEKNGHESSHHHHHHHH
ncbi:unnamed protein product [Psylliodes chrysocephalus]|uniref:Seminal fluid protein n=1 Tax=Psylliodes chrysocephalus TaxID=3402493 RepID=A0A9P0D7P9_9CUCU|nr:unnamed protein product [Psylliodes chrysocephala]